MADTRKSIDCSYCGATFSIKWDSDELTKAEFCCFCGESFDPNKELEDEEEDEDDYLEDDPEEAID